LNPGSDAAGHDNQSAPGKPLDCRLEQRHGATIVHVVGEADLIAHAMLSDALTGAFDLRKPVILDLNNLTYLDGHGISLLLRHQQRAAAAALRVVIANPSRIVRRVVDVLELDGVLPVFSSIEGALQAVDGQGRPSTSDGRRAMGQTLLKHLNRFRPPSRG
jgi:anti-anti-sigma factor